MISSSHGKPGGPRGLQHRAAASPRAGQWSPLRRSHGPLLSDTSPASLSHAGSTSLHCGALWKPQVSWGRCLLPPGGSWPIVGRAPTRCQTRSLASSGVPAPLPPPGRALTVLSPPAQPCLSGPSEDQPGLHHSTPHSAWPTGSTQWVWLLV